jgi:hypothetical protein
MSFSLRNVINFLNLAAPKGIIDSAESWVNQRKKKSDLNSAPPAAWCKGFGDAHETIFHNPDLGAPADYPELRDLHWTATPESKLFYIRGARVLGAEAAVISPDNRVFREFTWPPAGWLDHSCFKRRRIPAIKELDGWYATITYPSSKFYFHWMVESLPRMKLLEGYTNILDGVIVPEGHLAFHEQSMQALGIPACKLIPAGPNSHYKVRHLFVPKYYAPFNRPGWLHWWFKNAFLGDAVNTAPARPGRRIYISRADAPGRRVTNEAEVIDYLKSMRFELFTLANMKFLDQARLFFNAEVVVASHGAALSNLVYCRPGTRVMEIFTPNWIPPCYFFLARAGGLRYASMVGKESKSSSGRVCAQMADLSVPLDLLRQKLECLLV